MFQLVLWMNCKVNEESVKPIPNHRGNRAKICIIDEL